MSERDVRIRVDEPSAASPDQFDAVQGGKRLDIDSAFSTCHLKRDRDDMNLSPGQSDAEDRYCVLAQLAFIHVLFRARRGPTLSMSPLVNPVNQHVDARHPLLTAIVPLNRIVDCVS